MLHCAGVIKEQQCRQPYVAPSTANVRPPLSSECIDKASTSRTALLARHAKSCSHHVRLAPGVQITRDTNDANGATDLEGSYCSCVRSHWRNRLLTRLAMSWEGYSTVQLVAVASASALNIQAKNWSCHVRWPHSIRSQLSVNRCSRNMEKPIACVAQQDLLEKLRERRREQDFDH